MATALCFITNACNLMCQHCFASSGIKKRGEMNLEDWYNAFFKLKELGVTKLVFLGGEPFMVPWLQFLVSPPQSPTWVVDNFEEVSIQTNGTVLDANVLDRINYFFPQRQNFSFVISLEDVVAANNDNIRGAGEFNKAVMAIRKLRMLGWSVWVRTTIYSWNDVLGVRNLANELGANFTCARFLPFGYGERLKEWVPSAKRLLEIYAGIDEAQRKGVTNAGKPLKITQVVDDSQYYLFNAVLRNEVAYRALERGRLCPASCNQISVSALGNISACHMHLDETDSPWHLGNILTDSVEAINEKRKAWEAWRHDFIKEGRVLQQCEFCRFFAWCGGGCTVYTAFSQQNGELVLGDSDCPLALLEESKKEVLLNE
jgi:radical SAM protein with 4Fe4S-binding SPASM domain